ncbi:membrane protein [Bacillus sp. KH172YL63]|nr:PepSY domain-containing protein [Bacillus sp. KH172YL63]BCB04236.1 membrane protein [Bacillus sp. KH172YL63]
MKNNSPYRTIWRWHFYAGIIIAPFLLILAVTGSIYLFKPQIEHTLYKDFYEVKAQGEILSPSEQIEIIKGLYPDAQITKYRQGENPERSSEIGIITDNGSTTVFLDPYFGKALGELKPEDKIMNKVEEIHGELMAGTFGDRIVELAACWTVVLIVTGLYLWFPRKKDKLHGVFFPRFRKGRTILFRDLHAVPAFWITTGMLFLIMTGLPWSGFWGANFQNIMTNTGAGYPPSIWSGEPPESALKTKEIAEVPWAAENLEVPVSALEGFTPLSLNDVAAIAEGKGIKPGYTVYIPQNENGVYTLSAFPDRAQDEVTMHLDQYTGAVLSDYRYVHYGPVAKAVALGITLHTGKQFGLINQLFSLFICLGIILVVVSGFYLWLKRKPNTGMGAPKGPGILKMKPFLLLMILLGILFPLVGLSLIVVLILDWLVIKRIPALNQFLGGE